MYGEVLKFGAMIVDSLRTYKHPVFVYIPPGTLTLNLPIPPYCVRPRCALISSMLLRCIVQYLN